MKFVTFLKIFGLALAGFVGALGVGVGVMAIAGTFNDPVIQPDNIAFVRPADSVDGEDVSIDEFLVDQDFTAKIVTTTENVTETKIVLSFPNSSNVTERDGKISDGVVIVPKVVNIGEKFSVELVKITSDNECDGMEWIAGGHSVIRATSENPKAESARIPIHVDVPIYDVELKAQAGGIVSDTFIVDTDFYANLVFYPARSAYQYSFDGSPDGEGGNYKLQKKNAYYMLTSGNDQYISQVDYSNQFHAKAVGNNSRIDGYIFSNTTADERMLAQVSDLSGQEKHNAILQSMRNAINSQGNKNIAFYRTTNVNVVDIDVDRITATGDIPDVLVNTKYTMYANNSQSVGKNDIDLGIRLVSNYSDSANLQSKLKNVGIRFLYRQGNNYYSAYNNENDFYNVIQIPEDGVGQTKVVVEDGVEYTYFFPIITSNISSYRWEFALSRYCGTDSIYVQIKYFDTERDVEVIQKSFSTKIIVSNQITWNDLSDIELKIVDGESPVYKFVDIKSRANVPQTNLYQTKKYFAFSDSNAILTNYIHAEAGVLYSVGSQAFTLYELPDGILQAKNVEAHGLVFNVLFVTVQTDYNGNIMLEDNKYIINQFSQDVFGAVSAVVVNVNKTLLGLNYNLVTSDNDEDLIKFDGDEVGSDALAYVHTHVAPFDILVSCKKGSEQQSASEEGIFRQAVIDEKIKIVAKVNGEEYDRVYISNVTEDSTGNDLTFRFSMSIRELPTGTSDLKVILYVVYDKGEEEVDEYRIDKYNDDGNLSFIEVYNGAAVTFAFNLNICPERTQEPGVDEENNGAYKTSADRRVVVNTVIETSTSHDGDEEEHTIVTDISTEYLLDNEDISDLLFVTKDGNVEIGNPYIVLKDKHDKLPLSALYTLESTNTAIMVVSENNTLVFTGNGDVELRLIYRKVDGTNEVKDILYFTCLSEGHVTKVEKAVQDGISLNKTVEFVYDSTLEVPKEYKFGILTIPVYGCIGFEIPFNRTDGTNNLISYYYSYGEVIDADLVNKMVFTLVNEDDLQLQESGHIQFVKADDSSDELIGIYFNKDFGIRKTIQIHVTVPELGISQIIELDVRPNVKVEAVSAATNPVVESPKGSNMYNGVYLTAIYSDALYMVDVTLEYEIWSSADTTLDYYYFEIFDVLTSENKRITSSNANNEYVRIVRIDRVANGPDSRVETSYTGAQIDDALNITRYVTDPEKATISYRFYFVFESQQEQESKVLILSLRKEQMSSVDVQKDIYLNLNQNVKVTNSTNDLYLITQNTDSKYGYIELYGINAPISVSRAVINSDDIDESIKILNKEIRIRIAEESGGEDNESFIINGYTLVSKAPITNQRELVIDVLYNGVVIKTITFLVKPNLKIDNSEGLWVIYGENSNDYYLKFVNGQEYTEKQILDAFNFVYDGELPSGCNIHVEIDYSDDRIKEFIGYDPSNGVYNARGSNSNFVYPEFLVGSIVFNNAPGGESGDRVTFRIMILPTYLPLMVYRDGAGNIIDTKDENLYDLLDVEYLRANSDKYCYVVKNAGDEESILFTKDYETNNLVTYVYGEKYVEVNITEDEFVQGTHYVKVGDNYVLAEQFVGGTTYYIKSNDITLQSSDYVGLQYIDSTSTYYSIQNYDSTDTTDYAYISFVNDSEDVNKKAGMLRAQQVGKDVYIVLYCTLDNYKQDSIIVPYLIKIPKELEIKTYYPYAQGASNNEYGIEREELVLKNPNFDMEYLSFEDGKAQVNMLEKFTKEIPNSKYGYRYVIGKDVGGVFTKIDHLSALSEVVFTVGELWYYSPGGWESAVNIGEYALFSSNVDGNGLLTVFQRNAVTKVRLRIDITTRSGIYASYYISVGEKPLFYLTDNNGTAAESTLNVIANNSVVLVGEGPNAYKLSQSLNNTVTDATALLNFYSYDDSEYKQEPNITVNNTAKTLSISESTRNWQTELFVYTIYGLVQVIDVNITSDYSIVYQDNNIITIDEYESNLYDVYSGSVVDLNEYFKLRQNQSGENEWESIEDFVITFDNSEYPQIYVVDDSKIAFGSVKNYTRINIDVEYMFDSAKVYNFTIKVKVIPFVQIGYYNNIEISSLNMYGGISDVEAGTTEKCEGLLGELFSFADNDYKTWLNSTDICDFRFELLTVGLNRNQFTATFDADYNIDLATRLVATQTTVSFKVSLINMYGGEEHILLSSYFQFTLAPTFRIAINYPTPNDTAVVAAEVFYCDASNTTIDLTTAAIFEEKARIEVLDLNGDPASADIINKIFVITNSDCVTCNDSTSMIDNYIPFTNANFTIDRDRLIETSVSVIFDIVYIDRGDSGTDDVIPSSLGSYNLIIDQSESVFTAQGVNFNNVDVDNYSNKSGNPENIYIGTKDNVMNKVYVNITIPNDAVISSDKYISIKKIGGQGVDTVTNVPFGEGSEGQVLTVSVILNQTTFDHSGMIEGDSEDYVIYDTNTNAQIHLYDSQGNIVKPKFSFTSRIKLTYRTYVTKDGNTLERSSEVVDFFKMYDVLDLDRLNVKDSEIATQREFAKEIKLKLFNNYDLGTYYVNYSFDVVFDTYRVELSTSESTTLLKDSPYTNSEYYKSLLNIRHKSSSNYYESGDFGKENGLRIVGATIINQHYTSYVDTLFEDLGYLSMSPVTNDANLYLDYIFIAMGAPKFDTVTLEVKVTIGYGSATNDFIITFIVDNDYEDEYLRNPDNTLNRQTDRSRLAAGNTYIVAVSGSTTKIENFVYIKHMNENESIYKGNVASFFSVNVTNQGVDYANFGLTSDGTLSLRIDEIEFGNSNLDITFRDSYGYEFTYYVTIVAKYNPIYQQGDITIFEQDTVSIVKYGSSSNGGDVLLPVSFEKRESDYDDIDIERNDLVTMELTFTKEDSAQPLQDVFKKQDGEDKYRHLVNYIPQSEFLISRDSETGEETYAEYIQGVTTLLFKYNGSHGVISVPISINTTIREKYSVRSTANPYVRDGVAFSILDIIDVYDNKQEVAIGDRSLRNVQSIYYEYTIKDGENDVTSSIALDDSNDFSNNMTIGIKAVNKNNGIEYYRPITSPTGSYITIQDLFEDIDNILNYRFTFYYNISEDVTNPSDSRTWSQNTILTQADYNSPNRTTWLETAPRTGDVIVPSCYFTSTATSKTYTFTITKAYIVEDQIFTIALRPLTENNKINVHLYNETLKAVKTFDIYADSEVVRNNAVQSYSLRKLGLTNNDYTVNYSLYTNTNRTIIRGISNDDLLRLKGIKFSGYDDTHTNLDVITNNTVVKYIEYTDDATEDEIFDISDDGILYSEGQLRINVAYALTNGTYIKKKDNFIARVKVTLKFVGVDTRYAYGSDIARKIEYQTTDDSLDNYITKIRQAIDLSTWAGDTKRPIYVVAGYTDATSFSNEESNTLCGNGSAFVYTINTSITGSSGLYEFDSNGSTIHLKEGFGLSENYIAINVNVKYGNPIDHATMKNTFIGTVLLRFRNITTNTINFNLKTNKLLRHTANSVTANDILKLFTVTDNSDSVWNGNDIKRSFGSRIEFSVITKATLNTPDADREWYTFANDDPFAFVLDESANERVVAIRLKCNTNRVDEDTGNLIYSYVTFSNIQLVDDLFESDCLIAGDEYDLEDATNEVLINKLSKLVKFKDIYNENIVINFTSDSTATYRIEGQDDATEITGIGYKIQELTNAEIEELHLSKNNAIRIIKVSYGYLSDAVISTEFGSVYVRIFKKQGTIIDNSITREYENSSGTIQNAQWYNVDNTSIISIDNTRDNSIPYNVYIGGDIKTLSFSIPDIPAHDDVPTKTVTSCSVLFNNGSTACTIPLTFVSESNLYIGNTGLRQLYTGENEALTLITATLKVVYNNNDEDTAEYTLDLYKDLFSYLAEEYQVNSSSFRVKLINSVSTDTNNSFAEFVTFDGATINYHDLDAIDARLSGEDPPQCIVDGYVKFKLVVYYNYTNDCPDAYDSITTDGLIQSEQKEVILFSLEYSIKLYVPPEEPSGT